MPRHPRALVVRLIALFKLVKAVLLMVIGAGALSLRNQDGALATWLHAILFDPHGRYLHEAIARLRGLDPRQLEDLAVGSWLYAAVFLVEGTGLALRRTWAEVMTVIVTTSFIPLEIYELVAHRTWPKIAALVLNTLIVLYLVLRLRRERHGPFADYSSGKP